MVFERRFNKYLDNVKSSIFSPYLSGFRENRNFQLLLLKIAEAQNYFGKEEFIAVIPMDF